MNPNALNGGIYTALTPGTAGTALTNLLGGTFIYHQQAPDNTSLPYVLFNWQGGGLTPDHDIVSGLEWVRAYGTTAAQAGSIYVKCDTILGYGSITVTGMSNIELRQEDYREYVENLPNTEPSYVCGAVYRVILDI